MNAQNNEYIDFKYTESHDRDKFIYLFYLQICDLETLMKKKKAINPNL